MPNKIPRLIAGIALGWTLLFWLGCVAIPVGAVFWRAGGLFALWDPSVLSVVRATMRQAFISTFLSILIGLPLGLWVGEARAAGRPGGESAARWLAIPFGIPTVVAGTAWILWIGRSGLFGFLDLAYTLHAVILAHVFYNAPLVALIVSEARAHLPPRPFEAAEMLGAGTWARFRFIVWPGVRLAVASAACQVFALCAMSFALVMILGGGPPVQTLETALYGKIRFGSLDVAGAAACAVWEMLITLTPWILVLALKRGNTADGAVVHSFSKQGRESAGGRGWLMIAAAGFFVVPYLAILTAQFSRFSEPEFRAQLASPVLLSFKLAIFSAIGALFTAVAGVIAARKSRWFAALLSIPSGISVLVLGLGAWLAYGSWIDPFSGSFAAMLVLQITLFFPIAFRFLWPLGQTSQARLLEASATLGASPLQAFRVVEWPRWKRPLIAVFSMVAGASLGEVAAVSLFYSENLIPMPLLIQRAMAQYRFEDAQAISALLFILTAATIGLGMWQRETRRA